MNITLVYPPMWVHPNEFYGITPPLGLCYIASVLEQNGHKVSIINAQEHSNPFTLNGFNRIGLSLHNIVDVVKRTHPDIVGITCPLSIMWNDVSGFSNILRSDYDCLQIIGGFHPTAFPNQCLNDSSADIVVMGEGEQTFSEIVELESKGSDITTTDGIAWKSKDQLRINNPRKLIEPLDSIPFPARHLIDMEKYISLSAAQGSQKRKRYSTIISSRGCPNNCTFCSAKVVWTRKWRPHSAEYVVSEIEHLISEYRINEIHFEDDNISLDKTRMNRICDLIIKKDLDITWTVPNGIEVRTLDKPLIQKMKKSGCYHLNFGIESGNKHILNNVIRKRIDLDYTKQVIQWSKEEGIWTHSFFIMGFPTETESMMRDSLQFAKDSGVDSAFWNIATPYPSTELYRMITDLGIEIDPKDFLKMRGMDNAVGTDIFTPEELKRIQKNINDDFFKYRIKKELNPINMVSRLKNIKSMDDIKYYVRKFNRMIKVF